MSKNKKFKPGAKIKTLNHLIKLLQEDQWIYWRDKPKHPEVINHMPFAVIREALKAGILRQTISNADNRKTHRQA